MMTEQKYVKFEELCKNNQNLSEEEQNELGSYMNYMFPTWKQVNIQDIYNGRSRYSTKGG